MIQFVKAETEADLLLIAGLANTIWREHYTPIIGIDQVEYMLEKYQSVPAMLEQIDGDTQYYLMVYENHPAGYLSFYPKEGSLFLSKIYVLDSLRGQGIGKAAMRYVEGQMVSRGYNSIFLTVNKNNVNSIKAYEKMGFVKTEEVVMDIGNGYVMDDFVMEKPLRG